jgi:microcin C transport system substrate-binding protein
MKNKLIVLSICLAAGAFVFFKSTQKPEKPGVEKVTAPVSIPAREDKSTEGKSNISKVSVPLPQGSVHALSRFGEPKYAADFSHFNHVNPHAPKGGSLRLSTVGTFDTLNKDAVKGISAEGLLITFDPLMTRSADEPFTLYGVIVQGVELAPDYSWIIFHINPKACFHDGTPITGEDVEFTYKLLTEKGLPRYRQFYSRITRYEHMSPHTLKLHFQPNGDGQYDPELPLIVSLLRVLSKKHLENVDFADTGLTPIMGSGPYKVSAVDQGRFITFERVADYWGKDLPVNRGSYNFDTIRIEYFKNAQAQFQAFVAGEFDVYFESNPNQWELGYNFPAINNGSVKKVDSTHQRPTAVRTIIYNMRRPIFSDIRVRKALALALDFDTLNKVVFYNVMQAPNSLFSNTFLAHSGMAEGKEKELLLQFKDQIDPQFLETLLNSPFQPARTNGNGDQRENLAKADQLLKEAGWTIENGIRVNGKGEPLSVELLIKDPRLEKVALSLRESLKKVGVNLTVRLMDAVQYENRVVESDFDMIVHTWSNSLSPGNEQLYYFSAKNADIKGSSNYIGVKDSVAEQLARQITMAKTLDDLKASVHALDRYIMHQNFQIPLSYDNKSRWAYWVGRFEIPEVNPEVGTNVMNWGWAGSKNMAQSF